MTTHKSDSIQDRRQKPWAMVEIELLRDPRITPQCKALYGLLITYGPQSIFPGQDTLAECLGTTRQTVKRWLDDLKLQGLIDWENRTGTSNKYYILGYANFKRGDVTPTLQGCNTSVTGDVTPTLHDLDPLILNQELERPPLADSPVEDSGNPPQGTAVWEENEELALDGHRTRDYYDGLFEDSQDDDTEIAETAAMFKASTASQEAPEKRIERLRDEYGIDPLGVAAVVVHHRAAVAHPDGGDASKDGDPWADKPLRAFCALVGQDIEHLKESKRKDWPRELHKWAQTYGHTVTPQEAFECIRGITQSEFNWMTFTSPRQTTFQEALDAMVNRFRGGKPWDAGINGKRNGASGGRNDTPQVDQAVAETMARLFDERGVRIRRE